jgi:hypothetical protein
MQEKLFPIDAVGAALAAGNGLSDALRARGKFIAKCHNVRGRLLWQDEFFNTVVTVGKNAMLDDALAGSSYTVTGPFMGLISSTSFSSIQATDTMSSHSGWLEAGNANTPHYSGNRGTCAWSAASGGSKSLSAGLVFTFTGSGTVKGAFITFGSGAVNTIDNTGGTLFSAGLFSGGDQPVVSTNTLTITYSVSL